MKILMVNKFLYPRGGAETYILKLGDILKQHGHAVEYFGLSTDKNTVGNRLGIGVTDMDFSKGILRNLKAPLRIIYNAKARRQFRRVLEDFQPDVVHLNNIQYHLTPSVILALRDYRQQTGKRVKLIYTAHDYQLICPSHGLFDTNIRVCEKCLGGNYWHCVKKKCLKGSRAKSLMGTMDAYFWKWNHAYEEIDQIICCSQFLKNKLDTQERFCSKTVALHNFTDRVEQKTVEKGNYVLEFGHLSRDKGTLTLLEVAKRMPDIKFLFSGYGAAETEIVKVPNAEYVGFKTGSELETLIRCAAVSVYPSQWYENCPFSVIESQMYGTPVIASRIGGIPELIREGETGELFEAGNVDELEAAICKLLRNPNLLEQYTKHCVNAVFETQDSYYEKLMAIYGAENENI